MYIYSKWQNLLACRGGQKFSFNQKNEMPDGDGKYITPL